jgi:hypothetical protein
MVTMLAKHNLGRCALHLAAIIWGGVHGHACVAFHLSGIFRELMKT